MPDIKIVQFPLEKLFRSKRGNSNYTKKYCNTHIGEYEVFTGTTIGSFGKINTYEYSTPQLTYTTDGEYAGTVALIEDEKFNIGGHRAILIPNSENLYLKYFHYILGSIIRSKTKDGSVPSVTWANIKRLEIPVPIKENGEYDVETQREIAYKYELLSNHRAVLRNYMEQLDESYIRISDNNCNYKEVPLNTLFKYKRGRSCTREYCNQHKGNYPVWSANNIEPLAYVDFNDYEGRYISLSRNGIAGKITILNGKFTINEDRFLLVPLGDNIDYDFIKYTVEPILRSKKKGRAGHDGQNEFTKISFTILDKVMVRMPVTEDGEYDIEVQQQIAKKYDKLYKVKEEISKRIEQLITTEIFLSDDE